MRSWFRSVGARADKAPSTTVQAVAPDAAPIDAAKAHWDAMYSGVTRSAWTQNPIVERALYLRMTGDGHFWLEWVFNEAVPPVERLLSIGCGDGVHEIIISRLGYARHVDAFDASPVAIERAREIVAADNLAIDFSVRRFEQFAAEPGPDDVYDAVLFSGSLHHVTDLEGMLSAVRRVLKPGGKVIVNEYCGACYQLYPQSQVDIVNRVLASTPDAFRAAPVLELPSIDMIMAADPTEGVRAPLIPVLVPAYFETRYERFLGGGLLHPIFTCLNADKVNDGSPESRIYVEMLVRMEDELTRAGALPQDFMFGIYENR